MNFGETLTRVSVWLAIAAYAAGRALSLGARGRESWVKRARGAWTVGCFLFVLHVACAFTYYHHWSHAAAYAETAFRTRELTGIRWGGGLYFNYAFAVAWVIDTTWWWLDPVGFGRRSPRVSAVWHFFLFFMVFNGTVVFGSGPVRWFGALICGSLALLWWREKKGDVAGETPAR